MDVTDLVQPNWGAVASLRSMEAARDEPRMYLRVASAGDVKEAWSMERKKRWRNRGGTVIRGAGSSPECHIASTRAVAEALERYSAAMYLDTQFIHASANDLGNAALDLDSLPRCSDKELAHPKCPLVRPDKTATIRWVQGISITTGQLCYIPAIMVYLYLDGIMPAERIWLQTSTGCAAQISYEQAVISGILEVIERDAIAVTWLQRLSRKQIDIDHVFAELPQYKEAWATSSRAISYVLLNATTDLAIPVVLGVQRSPFNTVAKTLISCAAGTEPMRTCAKVLDDMAIVTQAFREYRPYPQSWDEFCEIHHGASFMGHVERAQEFDFMIDCGAPISPSELPSVEGGEARIKLKSLVDCLAERGHEIFAVDISTDEAIRAKLSVVRVIIPSLMPLSFSYRARFLGHKRLYDAPIVMGRVCLDENRLNAWPQPFA
jgi:ribosomal protein S12 methylthiotransferase accessory factor